MTIRHFGPQLECVLEVSIAVVVGGTSLFGGRGGIGNTIVGAGEQPRCRTAFLNTPLLFPGHHPDAAQLALLNEVNKSDVGLVECIVPHWGASLSGFFTQQLIHG